MTDIRCAKTIELLDRYLETMEIGDLRNLFAFLEECISNEDVKDNPRFSEESVQEAFLKSMTLENKSPETMIFDMVFITFVVRKVSIKKGPPFVLDEIKKFLLNLASSKILHLLFIPLVPLE